MIPSSFFSRDDNDCEQPTDSASPVSQFVPDPLEDSSHLEPEHSQPAVGEPQLGVLQAEITVIRATDLTLGLRRIPAGFYVIVQIGDVQWQTTNKTVHVDLDVLEWNDRIVLPSQTSYKVRFSVYASFELGPMLGHGDLLRTFDISIGELLDRSENSRPIVFQPKAGEVVSQCTSLLIAVEQALAYKTEVVLCPITPTTSYGTSALAVSTDAGHSVLERYHRTQNNKDLDQSIAHFESSLDLCPVDHPCRAAALFNLATAKFISCQVNGAYLDLDISISLFQDALDVRPTGHPDSHATQLNLAIALLSRFTKRGFETDADSAEALLNEILDVCHTKSSIYRAALLAIETSVRHQARDTDHNDFSAERSIPSVLPLSVNELTSLAELCSQSDDLDALYEVISLHYDALEHYGTAHHDRSTLLSNLGIILSTRFQRQGDDLDLDEAIACSTEALTLHPVGHPHRESSLNNLANLLSTRFEQRGNDKDLDEAIALHREVMTLRPVGHPRRPSSLNNLAIAFSIRFEQRGNDKDLDEAIVLYMEAQTLHPVGHPHRDLSLNNLAIVLLNRFEQRGSGKDLDEAIALHREALTLRQVGHPLRPSSLNHLASVLSTRFKQRGNDKDLDEAIAFYREAQTLSPVGHPDRPSSLNNLASDLSTRFKQRGNGKDIDEAITLYREALTLRPVGQSHRPSLLNNLANVLSTRSEQRGDVRDLDEAIMLHREALALHPVGHPHRQSSLKNFAIALSTRFKQRGNDKDLDEVIALYREAQTLHPVGHEDWPLSLNALAIELLTRFNQRGNEKDLDEAIALHREALIVCPVGHPHRDSSLCNLSLALSTRFKERGNAKDLDDAIMLDMEALTLHPVGHPDRPLSLNNLAGDLWTRFNQRGNNKDLDETIAFYREAQTLRPIDHPDRPLSLNNLAIALWIRFEKRGNDRDLDEAIVLHREALTLHPVSHLHRPWSLYNLANALSTCFNQRGNDKDLNEAITLHREAHTLRPVGHSDRPASLNSLASVLLTRFQERGANDKDLDEAIALLTEAHTLRPVGHPDRPQSLHNFANALFLRFEHRGTYEDRDNALVNARSALTLRLAEDNPLYSAVNRSLATMHLSLHESDLNRDSNDTDNLNAAIYHLKTAVDSVSSGLLSRLKTSLLWVRVADEYSHTTLLEAYAASIQLLDAYMSATASVPSRHHTMKAFPGTLAVDAASSALQHGDICRAVELLEQGRTIIWTQMARFRTPLDSLVEHGHAQALLKKFRELSSLLDKPPARLPEGTPVIKIEAEATRHTRLVDDWNNSVQEIRKLEGFSRFMLPPLFSDLQDAARDGPVIILIASKSCDAIIIPHQHSPVNVRLATNPDKLADLVHMLQLAVAREGDPWVAQTVEREGRRRVSQTRLVQALRELWTDVVFPVVESLARFARPGSRIWWCPTSHFNFLPLHAAGEYKRGGRNLSQSYISSYIPSLTALIKARKSHDRSPPPTPFAAIGQDHPPGFKYPLLSVEPELELVGSLLPPALVVSFTKLTSVESTKSRALRTLQDNHWLHFACHGTQNIREPFQSAFLMRDRPLALLDITQTDLSRHEFAFLSACETAVGDFKTPDEVIHLAAGLQFAGVKSVIGTFWSVEDATVRRLVEEFYKHFCGDGKMNSKRAARALHKAVLSLTNDKEIALDQRILFMHIGL